MSLHWLPIKYRIDYKILTTTYKALHGLAPEYLSDMVTRSQPRRTLRSASRDLLDVPRYNLKYGEKSYSYAAPTLWNTLPGQMKSKDLNNFKRELKTFLFVKAYD